MYDVHCHILPAFDDGASNLEVALKMARIAVADGITHLCCTPHIYPGVFDNNTQNITEAVEAFRIHLKDNDIALTLGIGADIQHVAEMVPRLNDGTMPTINDSKYVLFEPPHHIAPPHFETSVYEVLAAGYTPLITHPERLSWIETHYDKFRNVASRGAWMQLTAGSLAGHFGKRVQYWAQRMLDEGFVYLLATDAHNTSRRAPRLSEGYEVALNYVDEEEAMALVYDRPKAVWENQPVQSVTLPPGYDPNGELLPVEKPPFWKRLFG